MERARLVLVVATVVGCSAPDAGELRITSRRGRAAESAEGGASRAPVAPPEGGDAFAATAPFASRAPATSSTKIHGAGGHAGDDCLSCHDGTRAKAFAFAGTAYADKAGTRGACNVEVRVVAKDGSDAVSVYTDEIGNFWSLGPARRPGDAVVGIRDGSGARCQSKTALGGACNGCHGKGGAAPPIHVGAD